MQNEELRDILLDKDDEKKGLKLKKLLIIIGAFIILFLAVFAIVGIINSDDKVADQSESRLLLPPTPSTSVTQPLQEQKKSDDLFEQVPITQQDKTEDDFEGMLKRLKEKENLRQTQASKSVEQPKQDIVVAPKPSPKPKEQPKPSLDVPTKTKAQTKSKPKATSQDSSTLPKGAYVQVLATSKFSPDSEYLRKIKAKGYTYHLLKVGNVSKVLVGPFNNSQLNEALKDVRKDIIKDAFVYRVK